MAYEWAKAAIIVSEDMTMNCEDCVKTPVYLL